MTFDAFRQEVFRLAKKKRIVYLVPGIDDLCVLWEQKTPVDEVLEKHCTAEAQRRRHGITTTKP